MTAIEQLAEFAGATRFDRISTAVCEALKIRVLDTIGVCIGALDAAPELAGRDAAEVRDQLGAATLIGGGQAAAETAARQNVTLSRHLDFMDAYLAPAGVCHPSDSIGALLPIAETVDASGQAFLAALAVAYAVHTRLVDALAPDAVGEMTYAASTATAAAAAKILRLDADGIARAVHAAQRQVRASGDGPIGQPSGAAGPAEAATGPSAPQLIAASVRAALQTASATPATSGPVKVDRTPPTDSAPVDWPGEALENVLRTLVLRHNADPLAQSAIDAAISLTTPPVCDTHAIRRVRLKTFQAAYDALGGNVPPDARRVDSRRAGIHSLAYLAAVALLDHQVQPAQFEPSRLARSDVQGLLRSIELTAYAPFTRRYPAEMPAQIEVQLTDGTYYCTSAVALQEFTLWPLPWEVARDKFYRLVVPLTDEALARRIAQRVHDLDCGRIRDLTALLGQVSPQRRRQIA